MCLCMSNPYIIDTASSLDSSMELGLHSILHPWLHSKTSQYGITQTMKKMMKEVTGKIESYTSKKHEMQILQNQVIKEMNDMELFYRHNQYNDNKPKPYLEQEVIDLYESNRKRITNAGINHESLKILVKNSQRKQDEERKIMRDEIRKEEIMPVNSNEEDRRHYKEEFEKDHGADRPVPLKHPAEKNYYDEGEYAAYERDRNGGNEFASRYEYCV